MIQKPSPFQGVNDFFEGYAKAIERQDTKYLAHCYALPCTFISDESSLVYTTPTKLENLINQSKHFYAIHGITTVTADVMNKLSISNKIIRVKLNWRYMNAKGKKVYDCDYFYILRLHDKQEWKIEVAISINEKEAISKLTKKTA